MADGGSFIVHRRDTDRARRNAEFLTRFTGCAAHPMVGSVSNDRAVQELVNAGAIGWFQLDARELEPIDGLFVAVEACHTTDHRSA